MRSPKLLKLLLPLLILALAIGVFAYLRATRPQKPVAASEERVWRVAVEPARPRRLAPQLVLYGRVETPDLLKVAAAGPARVAEVAVRDGQRVAAGDLLVRLDDRDFLPALRQAEAAVTELEALVQSEILRHARDLTALEQERKLLDLAQAGVERAERLKTQRAGSDADLDAAEQAVAQQRLAVNQRERDLSDHPARLAVLEARLASARAKVAEIALDLERSVVRAPFAGLVAGVEVTTGDQVKADAQLLRLYALADLEVRARIPAPYQAEIGTALAAGEDLRAWADLGGPASPLLLRLERLAGEAQASGADGLFRVLAGAEALRLGQVVELRLERPAREGLVAVPAAAVQGGKRLYRVEAGRLRGLPVEVVGTWLPAAAPWDPATEAAIAESDIPAATVGGPGTPGHAMAGSSAAADAGPGAPVDAQGGPGIPAASTPTPAPADEERLLVHSPALRDGDAILVTPLPNALEGLRVEVVP